MEENKLNIHGLNHIIPLKLFRKTPKVDFKFVPEVLEGLSAITRVVHAPGAFSPAIEHKSDDELHWYMHPCQEDNLLVLQGKRIVQLFNKEHGKVENYEITPDYLKHEGKIIFDGPCILGWPTHVFHRVESPDGSTSINFAKHFTGFDLKTNFTIYDLDPDTGKSEMAREGHLDQM